MLIRKEEALEYHVRGLEDAISGPLARAASNLDQATRRAKDNPYRERLRGEQVSMNFTLREARLYYHLLKGELRYRVWKRTGDAQAGLDLLTELALARYTWESQKAFVATAGMKANPLIPGTQQLQARAAELSKVVTLDPAKVQGVSEWGFSSDPLEEHLMHGVTGEILGGPSGSNAVVWTDLPASRKSLRGGGTGLVWRDELGRPLNVTQMDLHAAPVVVEAKGMAADKLFDELLKSQ